MKLNSGIARALPAFALVAAAFVSSAVPAQAENAGWWYNPSHGARGYWTDAGDKLTACDTEVDGFKAIVWLKEISAGKTYYDYLYDTGDDGKCTTQTTLLNLRPETYYYVQVCLANSKTRVAWCESGWHPVYNRYE